MVDDLLRIAVLALVAAPFLGAALVYIKTRWKRIDNKKGETYNNTNQST